MIMIMVTRTAIRIATTTIAAMIPGDRPPPPLEPGCIVCVGDGGGVEAVREWHTH